MRRLLDTIDELGGITTRRDLLRRGFTGHQLTAAVRAGTVRRVRQGHYALPNASIERLAAVRLGGRLGCLSATKTYGLWAGSDDDRVHVTLPANAARLRTNVPLRRREVALMPDRFRLPVVLHWRDVPVGRRRTGNAWRVDLPTALADVASCASRRDVRATFESAIHEGLLQFSDAQRWLDAVLPSKEAPMVLSAASGSGAESHRGYPTLRIPARVVIHHPELAAEMLRGAIRALHERSAA
ncbi:type IV toxin-antitoxin system AbiEi family antitoxin domain-containing protein [Agromyces sp. ISL-38]|uniref:type IV toxin-antitoxin system AbiEi family antitoxin domain-containing protein n=1 Tax=Agromyces sp. ISL-38 TaxID=2819107 RepID=UPI001BED285D|nr:type IV toxin-antitoxin system AbiEi family antitoxin domain-containing protein [Agromyces sp. ISL-38]MBT2500344.1 type IV toxin-antitoxin system AbiEi family antitoxin domain-containing protein [Agromyces sp. ISL-38]